MFLSTLFVLSSPEFFWFQCTWWMHMCCQVFPVCLMRSLIHCWYVTEVQRHKQRQNKRKKWNQNSHSLRKFTSGCFSLGDCDDIQKQECVFLSVLKIFIVLTVLWPIFIYFFFLYTHKLAFFWIVSCKRHLTNRQRYKVVRVGGWERTLSSLFQLRDRAEQVVWGYLLSLTVSHTLPQGHLCLSDAAESCVVKRSWNMSNTFLGVRWHSCYTAITRGTLLLCHV